MSNTTPVLDDIVKTITELVAREFGLPAERISADEDLRALEGSDSVKVLRAVAKIEHTYDIELEDDAVFGLTCVRDAAQLVTSSLAKPDRGRP